jgi:hypothetical protein
VPAKTFDQMFLQEGTRFEMAADHLAIKNYESKYPRDLIKEVFLEFSAYKNKKIMPIFMKYEK